MVRLGLSAPPHRKTDRHRDYMATRENDSSNIASLLLLWPSCVELLFHLWRMELLNGLTLVVWFLRYGRRCLPS